MKVFVNNAEVAIESHSTIYELKEQLKLPEKGIAIAINNNLIPKTNWENHLLSENDQVVIIKAACGG